MLFRSPQALWISFQFSISALNFQGGSLRTFSISGAKNVVELVKLNKVEEQSIFTRHFLNEAKFWIFFRK